MSGKPEVGKFENLPFANYFGSMFWFFGVVGIVCIVLFVVFLILATFLTY